MSPPSTAPAPPGAQRSRRPTPPHWPTAPPPSQPRSPTPTATRPPRARPSPWPRPARPVAEARPDVNIAAVEGNNVINASEAAAGVALSGTVSGLAANSTFNVTVTDNGVVKTYVATVNGAGTGWTATIPSVDATALANGTATVSAQVTDAHG